MPRASGSEALGEPLVALPARLEQELGDGRADRRLDVELLRLEAERPAVGVHDRDRGLFASADPELETLVRQDAERQILEASLEAGILDAADENAREYMKQFLGNLGFENVIFTDSPPPPPPAYEQPIPKGYFLGTPEPGGE